MLDIKILRNEPDKIREALKKRNNDLDITLGLLSLTINDALFWLMLNKKGKSE